MVILTFFIENLIKKKKQHKLLTTTKLDKFAKLNAIRNYLSATIV